MWLRRCVLLVLGILLGVGAFCLLVSSVSGTEKTRVLSNTEPTTEVIRVQSLPKADICLPAEIAGTGLVAKSLCEYDGPFGEDGSYEEVFGIAALMVENTTPYLILSAGIQLRRGEAEWDFYAEMIPPMGCVLVPESSRKICVDRNFTSCTGWAQKGQENKNVVTITPSTKGSYVVKNETMKGLTGLAVYHKDKISDIFVGGKAHRTLISGLEPGQTVEVFPSFFAWGSSEIVAVIPDCG